MMMLARLLKWTVTMIFVSLMLAVEGMRAYFKEWWWSAKFEWQTAEREKGRSR